MGATTAPGWRKAGQPSPFLGRVANYGAANRGTHFSRPHLRGAVGRYMNCQVRARLMLGPNCFGVSDRSAFCALQSAAMLRNRETSAVTFDVHVRLTHRISQTGVQNPAVAVQSMLT